MATPIVPESVDARLATLEILLCQALDRLDDLAEAFGAYADSRPAPSDADAADHFDYLESLRPFAGHDA